MSLQFLIAEAVALGGGNLCAAGHDWATDGGRMCPRGENMWCSQAVYRCARCGEYDYGDKGGPGYADCFVHGPCDVSCSLSAGEQQ